MVGGAAESYDVVAAVRVVIVEGVVVRRCRSK